MIIEYALFIMNNIGINELRTSYLILSVKEFFIALTKIIVF